MCSGGSCTGWRGLLTSRSNYTIFFSSVPMRHTREYSLDFLRLRRNNMARLIYIHKSLQSKQVGGYTWDPDRVCKNKLLTEDFATDGYVDFLEGLLERNIIDEAMVVIESNPYSGRYDIGNIECYGMPNLAILHDYLRPDDVLLMRGGYRWWIPFVDRMNKEQRWLIFYSAGTRRSFWPQWDVVINDAVRPTVVRNKLYVPWNKPINNKLFQLKKAKRVFDICIGASKIYDTKQQWKVIDAVVAYKKKYGEDLNCIIPGCIRRGTETFRMKDVIRKQKLSVEMPGYVSRKALAGIFNQSKIFAHQCTGQSDRGPIEAMSTGVPLYALSNNGCYAPWMVQNKETCLVRSHPDLDVMARDIKYWLLKHTEERRKQVSFYANRHNNIEFTYKNFTKLFECIKRIGKPDRARMIKEFMS